jgi:LPS sulfotransferase NodH
MALYLSQFDPALDANSGREPVTTLVIASTPRSGSHMLGHALGSLGLFPTPFEYCNRYNLPEWERRLGLSGERPVLAEIMRRRTGANGVFALKMHHAQCETLGGFKGVLSFFPNPRFVYLRRADVLRQAISHTIASQTGVWIEGQEGDEAKARYDWIAIARSLRMIALQNARWQSDFARNGITPLYLDFDRVQADLPNELARILSFLGLAHDAADLPRSAPTRSQGVSSRTEEWIQRFAEDSERALNVLQWPRRTARRTLNPLRGPLRRLVRGRSGNR